MTRPSESAMAAVSAGRPRSSAPAPLVPGSLVMHQPLDKAELNDRQRHDQDKEHDRFGACETELEILEGVEIDAVHERARGVDRATSREKVDLRERLQDGDRVDDQKEEK